DFNFGEITAAYIGRMNGTKKERDKLRQKVPGLRNVALTAPNFHRGDEPTLDGAVKLVTPYQVRKERPGGDEADSVTSLPTLDG
ncbi:cytochrome C551 peroxidase, partial [Escherichia coli]